jgi:hypothetical protein
VAQSFGTGGSPSPQVTQPGQAVTLTTTFARYSVTFALASVAGKTFGTAGDSSTQLNFWYSSGTTNATNAGNVGVQSGNVWLWGVQLEVGSVATPLEKPDPRYDLANCQRFYQTWTNYVVMGYNAAGLNIYGMHTLPTTMRASPSVAFPVPGQSFSNCSTLVSLVSAQDHISLMATVTATGSGFVLSNITLSADL